MINLRIWLFKVNNIIKLSLLCKKKKKISIPMWFVIYVSKKSCRPWERPGSLSQCQAMLGPIFFRLGTLSKIRAPYVTIVPPVCLLADTSNNPDIWPVSKLITTLDGIDPYSRGFPSRAVCFCFFSSFLFDSLLLFPLFFSMPLTLLSYSNSCMGIMVAQLGDECCCYEA